MTVRARGPSLTVVFVALIIGGGAIAQGPDLTPPTGIETRDLFIDDNGLVIEPTLRAAPGIEFREPFVDPQGIVVLDSLVAAPGILFRDVFVDEGGSVTLPSLEARPGLVFTELEISPDGTVITPSVTMPEGLNTRPLFIAADGSPIENPIVGTPRAAPRRLLESVGASPNPFNPSTELRFLLNAPARVSVQVYNARGARVRELFRGDLPEDLHVFRWNGLDDRGEPVASGTYLFRVVADGEEVSVKGVLVK